MNSWMQGPCHPPLGAAVVSPAEAARLIPFASQCASLLRHAAWCRQTWRPCPFEEASLAFASGVIDCYVSGSPHYASYPAGSLERALQCVSDATLRMDMDAVERLRGWPLAGPQTWPGQARWCYPPPTIQLQHGDAEKHLDGAAWAPQRQQPAPQLEKPPGSTTTSPATGKRRRKQVERYEPEATRPKQRNAAAKKRRPAKARREPAFAVTSDVETKRKRFAETFQLLVDDARRRKKARKVATKAFAPSPDRSRRAKSTAAPVESPQRAAGDLREVRALISNIASACVDESIVMGNHRGRTRSFIEGLVERYQPEHAGLTYDKLWEALRFELGYEMFGGETEELTTKKELEGLLPVVIEKTDSLMEKCRN